jgi:hypothetical protein
MAKADGEEGDEAPTDARRKRPSTDAVAQAPTAPSVRRPTQGLSLPVGARPTGTIPTQSPAQTPAARRATGQVPVASAPRRPTGQLPVAAAPGAAPRRPTGQVPAASAAVPAPRRPTGQVPVASAAPPPPRRATGELGLASARRSTSELRATPRMEEETTGPVPILRTLTSGQAGTPRKPTREQQLPTAIPRRATSNANPIQSERLRPGPPVAETQDDELTAPLSLRPSPRTTVAPPIDDEVHEATQVGALPLAPAPREVTAVGFEPTPTPIAPLPGSRTRGLSADPTARKTTASPIEDVAPDELSRVIRMEAARNGQVGGRRFGFQLAIGLIMLVIGLAAVAIFFAGHLEKPPLETLQMNYPYGFAGGRLPNGRTAPSVADLTFDYKESLDCGGNVCLRYDAHTADDSFHLSMDVTKVSGDWKLVGGPRPPGR